jgi:stage II sporulation protein M
LRKGIYQNVTVNYLRENSSMYLFVIVLFLIGVIFGAVIVNSLSFAQKEDLFYYLNEFFGQLNNGKIAEESDLFRQSFFHNSKFIGLMWILGISIIGLPVILILLFMKGMVVGFTVGFLVNQMGWAGFFLAFVSILPQNFIIIPVFIVTASVTVMFSLKMIQRQFLKKYGQPFLPLIKNYVGTFLISLICIGIAAAIEAYLSPVFMKSVINNIINL